VLVPAYHNESGRLFYTVAGAAARLGLTEPQVRRLIAKHQLTASPASILVDAIPPSRGRPATTVIDLDEVEERRRSLLELLDAAEPGPLPRDESFQERLDSLEKENAELRGQAASLREVIRLALVSEQAHLEQLRQLFAPTTLGSN
jgi:hypothetical protein